MSPPILGQLSSTISPFVENHSQVSRTGRELGAPAPTEALVQGEHGVPWCAPWTKVIWVMVLSAFMVVSGFLLERWDVTSRGIMWHRVTILSGTV